VKRRWTTVFPAPKIGRRVALRSRCLKKRVGSNPNKGKTPFRIDTRVKTRCFFSLFEGFCYTKRSNFVDWVIPFLLFLLGSRAFSWLSKPNRRNSPFFAIEHFLLKTRSNPVVFGKHCFSPSHISLENFYGTFTSKITGSIRTIWPYCWRITRYSGSIPSSSFCLASVDQFPLMKSGDVFL
jgi:hypothetical protein